MKIKKKTSCHLVFLGQNFNRPGKKIHASDSPEFFLNREQLEAPFRSGVGNFAK
jgi:hypothetical protein